MTEFFTGVIRDTIEYREKNNVQRKDFLQLLIDMKKSDAGITFNEIAANCFIFFFAGIETSASVATFTLYELALNQDIQDRLRQEIEKVLSQNDDEVTYDAIMQMKYLDMVFNESMRRYPIADVHVRKCCKSFNIPNSGITIEENTMMFISSNAFHNDERFFENPTKFDPERFNEENVKKQTPFTYLPFSEFQSSSLDKNPYSILYLYLGDGPRVCMGLRFGTMQTKVAIVKLLRNYRFSPSGKTLIPMKFAPSEAFQSPVGGMWLRIEKING